MSHIFEENRLISLLREFDTALTLNYLEKLKKFKNEAEDKELIDYFTPIADSSLADPIAFRVEFSDPILVMLSHPLCRMYARIHYPIEFEWERFYITQLGMLPVYLVDLNVITIIKFWAEAAEQVSPQALTRVLTGDATCMELVPTTRKIHYSTMNFVIPFGAGLWKGPGIMDKIIESYLKYSFWLSPKQGFAFSTHFLHSKTSIKYLLKVAKTLCLIDEINYQTEIQIMDKTIKVHKVSMRILTERNGAFFFMRRVAYVPDDVLKKLQSTQRQNHIRLGESFLNAIVLEIREKTKSFELLTVLSDIGASYFELAQTLIAYALMSIFNSNDKIVYICNINELKAVFNSMIGQICKSIRLPFTISDVIVGSFDLALESHYPIFIKEKDNIYYLHPLLLSFLHSRHLDLFFQTENRENMIRFLNYLEKMSAVSYMELYLDETLDMLRNLSHYENKKKLLSTLFRLTRIIRISKLLQSSF
jgi:hypothetical protein